MKFYKSLGLLAATAGLMLTSCGDGTTSNADIVKTAANADALIVTSSGTSFNHNRLNQLSYGTALFLANSMGADAKVKGEDGNITTSYVITKVTWEVSGDGAASWAHKENFDDTTNDYQYWKGTYPAAGKSAVTVTFTGTVSYGGASTKVSYNFSMTPKA